MTMCAPPNAACASRTLRRDLSIFKTNMQTVAFLPWFPASTAGACGDSFAPTDHGSLITGHPSATPLESALTRPLATVHSKGLIKLLSPLDATLTKKAGGWVAIFQFRFSSFQSAGACGDSFFFTDHGSLDTDHQSLTPLECAVPQNAALSPLECALTKTRFRKSFRMRTYKKSGGRGVGRR